VDDGCTNFYNILIIYDKFLILGRRNCKLRANILAQWNGTPPAETWQSDVVLIFFQPVDNIYKFLDSFLFIAAEFMPIFNYGMISQIRIQIMTFYLFVESSILSVIQFFWRFCKSDR
jgi:hypothetical protein